MLNAPRLSNAAPRIVLGITGGVAAYKSAELARLLTKAGIEVQVVLTPGGARFITALTLQAISGREVFSDPWDTRIANNMAHIELSRGASAILVAPASADFLAKLANGLADDLLSALCLARQPQCRLVVAPAMNREMWEAAATQRNVRTILSDGVHLIGPEEGDQACGEIGPGRMTDPPAICARILDLIGLYGERAPTSAGGRGRLRALVTAGPTYEPIDAVRGITNRSSGRMGYAIVESLLRRRIDVTLVSGPTHLPAPSGAKLVPIVTAEQLFQAVKRELAGVDLFFSVAAVADYTPAAPRKEKLKKTSSRLQLDLMPTTDVLAWVASQEGAPFCIGFAAESANIAEYASKKRQHKKIPLIVANDANLAIGAEQNEALLIDDSGVHKLETASKAVIAEKIVDHALRLYQATRSSSNLA
jgi:phosphopantothenoylcysteine decarboxylase/phosphopantothenate--cysteine ligase